MNARYLIVLAALGSPAWAQTAASGLAAAASGTPSPAAAGAAASATPAATAATADAPATGGIEPNVRVTVIEERGTRIEETRVRGQVTRVSVKPASGSSAGYEFLPERDLRDDAEGRSGSNSAIGKRVWRVLAF